MKQNEINEIHGLLVKIFDERNKTPTDVISFLTATWVGQMCLNNYSEEFVDSTLKRMKETWKSHPLKYPQKQENK